MPLLRRLLHRRQLVFPGSYTFSDKKPCLELIEMTEVQSAPFMSYQLFDPLLRTALLNSSRTCTDARFAIPVLGSRSCEP
jgi:hypothetical protein